MYVKFRLKQRYKNVSATERAGTENSKFLYHSFPSLAKEPKKFPSDGKKLVQKTQRVSILQLLEYIGYEYMGLILAVE